MIESQALLDKILSTQARYARIYRQTVNEARYVLAIDAQKMQDGDFDNELVRESDLEHIGHLPLLATLLHPHLENREAVDLGKSLVYLALHETPELEIGDILHESKNQTDVDGELTAAKNLLSGEYGHYYELYEDFHYRRNLNAQFAYSVDRLAPIVYHEFGSGHLRLRRWTKIGLRLEMIDKRNRQYFEWDKTLLSLFDHLMTEIKEQNRQLKINL